MTQVKIDVLLMIEIISLRWHRGKGMYPNMNLGKSGTYNDR